MKISRRRLLIGMNSVFAMMSMPKIALANVPKINLEAFAEVRPARKNYNHYFAFDHGIYAANINKNIKLKMGEVKKDLRNPMFIDGLFEMPKKRLGSTN